MVIAWLAVLASPSASLAGAGLAGAASRATSGGSGTPWGVATDADVDRASSEDGAGAVDPDEGDPVPGTDASEATPPGGASAPGGGIARGGAGDGGGARGGGSGRAREGTTEAAGESRDGRGSRAPFQPPGTTGFVVVVEGGDPQGMADAVARLGARPCRARHPEASKGCAGAPGRAVEYHVLASQPLTAMAYLPNQGGGRLGEGSDRDEASYRYEACRNDPRFEDGERISATLVAKTRTCADERASSDAVLARLRAVRAIVRAERNDGEAPEGGDDDADLGAGADAASTRGGTRAIAGRRVGTRTEAWRSGTGDGSGSPDGGSGGGGGRTSRGAARHFEPASMGEGDQGDRTVDRTVPDE